jgi:hypothetical protein
VRTAIEDVGERNGKDVWLLGSGKVGDVSVERDALLGGGGLCNGHAHTEDRIGTELGLVLGAVQLVQELVDLGLVFDVDGLFDQGRCDYVVDVTHGLGDTLSTPFGLVAVTEFAGFVGTGRGS